MEPIQFEGAQRMKADAIQQGLAGGYGTDYTTIAIFAGCFVAFVFFAWTLSKKKK